MVKPVKRANSTQPRTVKEVAVLKRKSSERRSDLCPECHVHFRTHMSKKGWCFWCDKQVMPGTKRS